MPDATVAEAVDRMRKEWIGALAVSEDGRDAWGLAQQPCVDDLERLHTPLDGEELDLAEIDAVIRAHGSLAAGAPAWIACSAAGDGW